MIASCIPFLRLPSSLHVFDYEVPLELEGLVKEGSIVSIPFRNRVVSGVIDRLHATPRPRLKQLLRLADPSISLSPHERQLIHWFAAHYGISASTAALQWASFFSRTKTDATPHEAKHIEIRKSIEKNQIAQYLDTSSDPILVRYSLSRDHIDCIQTAFTYATQSNTQLLIVCPTVASVARIQTHIHKHLPDSTSSLFHSSMPQKQFRGNVESFFAGKSQIGIGTRMAIFAPSPHIGAIVVCDSERIEYKQYDAHPRYDARVLALARGKIANIPIVFTSTAPRLEDSALQGTFFRSYTYPARIDCQVVNLKDEFRNQNFSFLTDSVLEKITTTIANGGKAFLVLNRTGYSRMVTCQHCKYIFSCDSCSGFPRYSSSGSELLCTRCETKKKLPATCPLCHGTEYVFPGLGIEKIASSLKKKFPTYIIKTLPANTVADADIVIGTSFAFCDIDEKEKFGFVGIITADPILSLSDFRSEERSWQALSACISKSLSEGSDIVLQAFHPEHPFVQSLKTLAFDTFASKELEGRKNAMLPPSTRLIKIMPAARLKSQQISLDDIQKNLELLKNRNETRLLSIIQRERTKGKKTWKEILITVEQPYHPLQSLPTPLIEYIRSLPAGFVVDIDPVEI